MRDSVKTVRLSIYCFSERRRFSNVVMIMEHKDESVCRKVISSRTQVYNNQQYFLKLLVNYHELFQEED